MEVLFPILIVLFVVGAIIAGYYAKKQRQKLFRGIAGRLGCRYYEDDPFGLSSKHDNHFATLASGSNRYAYNVIAGQWEGRGLHIFDHHYETYSHDKNGRTDASPLPHIPARPSTTSISARSTCVRSTSSTR